MHRSLWLLWLCLTDSDALLTIPYSGRKHLGTAHSCLYAATSFRTCSKRPGIKSFFGQLNCMCSTFQQRKHWREEGSRSGLFGIQLRPPNCVPLRRNTLKIEFLKHAVFRYCRVAATAIWLAIIEKAVSYLRVIFLNFNLSTGRGSQVPSNFEAELVTRRRKIAHSAPSSPKAGSPIDRYASSR